VRTRLLTITLAAVLALVGVVAILAYVRQANERAVNGLKAETVWVASGPIAAGTSLSAAQQGDLLKTEKVPDSSVTLPVPVPLTGVVGRKVVTSAVAKGQVLLQNMLGASASNASASGGIVVPSGDIAVSVDMCVPEDVADYVAPGSNVAVFDTLVVLGQNQQMTPSCSSSHEAFGSTQVQNLNQASTVLVLPSVLVLAVGQNPGSQSTSGSSSVATATDPASSSSSSGDVLVTFAVNQHEAQKLILLQEVGIPYLALLGSKSPTLGVNSPVGLFQQP
jgi:pilus assembly protein CpaB